MLTLEKLKNLSNKFVQFTDTLDNKVKLGYISKISDSHITINFIKYPLNLMIPKLYPPELLLDDVDFISDFLINFVLKKLTLSKHIKPDTSLEIVSEFLTNLNYTLKSFEKDLNLTKLFFAYAGDSFYLSFIFKLESYLFIFKIP